MDNRKSVSVKRKPITILSLRGVSYGGWAHFSKPKDCPKPTGIKLKQTERLLYCPYCGDWTIYKRLPDDQYTWKCTGWCGWSNTNDFYVKRENNLFGGISSGKKHKASKKK